MARIFSPAVPGSELGRLAPENYSDVVDAYEQARSDWHPGVVAALFRRFELTTDSTVLDIDARRGGCRGYALLAPAECAPSRRSPQCAKGHGAAAGC
jgi:hypothetical protein